MDLYYNPLDTKYKSQKGAVMVNSEFTITVSLHNYVDEIYVVVTKDGEDSMYYAMTQFDGGAKINLTITTTGLYFYHFFIKNGGQECRFYADDWLYPCTYSNKQWQLTCTPKKKEVYFNDGIIYQIFVDRFNIGGKQLKTKNYAFYHENWFDTPIYAPNERGIVQNIDFFGGNLRGVIEKLPYLKSLNVGCIYLNPIFQARSNHKYDTADYLQVDSDFGTEDDLKELINEAKKLDIGIMLDGVFSHTGDDSIYFNKYGHYDSLGAYQSPQSPYYSWYTFSDYPNSYESWWGINILPNVVETDKHYTEFICGVEGVIAKYLKMGIKGWRLDVADELPEEFLANLSHRVKHTNSDAILLGEVWEDASNKISYSQRRHYFSDNELDSVTNYVLKNSIINFITSKNNTKLIASMRSLINNYPKNVLDNLMNVLDTHDTQRIITVYGKFDDVSSKQSRANAIIKNYDEAVNKAKLSAVIQYFCFGVPCVYYGDEVGLYGFEDPFNRKTYPYGKEDKSLLEFYRKLGLIRKQNIDILKNGEMDILSSPSDVLIFTRNKNNKKMTVIINLQDTDFAYDIKGKDIYSNKEFTGICKSNSFAIIL